MEAPSAEDAEQTEVAGEALEAAVAGGVEGPVWGPLPLA